MKKFLKSLLCFCCFALVFLTSAFACSAIEKVNAVDVQAETTHTVNFYGADNETIIYSVEVPDGKSLNDLTSSYLNTNTSFSTNYSGFYISPASFWNSTTFTYDEFAGLTLTNNIEFSYMNMWVNLPSSSYVNLDNIYVHFLFDELSDGFNMQQVYAVSRFGSDSHYYTKIYLQTGSYTIVKLSNLNYPDYSSMDIGFQFVGSNLNVSLKYFVVTSDSNFVYIDEQYLKQLFVNSGGEIGSNFEWSESSTSSSRFNFDVPITSDINLYGFNNTGSTFDLEAEISADYNNFGYYAINSVEFLEMSGSLVYHVNFTTNEKFRLFLSTIDDAYSLSDIYYYALSCEFLEDSFQFPNFYLYVTNPIDFDSDEFSSYFENDRLDELPAIYFDVNSGYSEIKLYKNVTYDIYFYNGSITSFNGFNPIFSTYEQLQGFDKFTYRYYDDFKTLVDMNDTNTSVPLDFENYQLFDSDSMNFAYNLISSLNSSTESFYLDYNSTNSVDLSFKYRTGSTILNSSFVTLTNSDCNVFAYFNPFYYSSEINKPTDFLKLSIDEFFFFIHRPSYRVDNTLVIYNFDYYNLLYSVNNVTYKLQVNGDFYDIIYNGKFPNNYFNYFYNDTVANTIYDEYVSLYLSFDDNVLVSENGSILLGFDFNFAYYVQPLVTSNGSYNYTFDKPGYVEMPFSLAPFHLPVLEAVENCMIFLVFYCPLISDVLGFLHFDLFFGGLISIFDFILGSGIGNFVLGCLAFIILWSILKSFFPSLVTSSRSIVNDIGDMQDFIDSPSKPSRKGRVKPYRFKSGLLSKSRKRYSSLKALSKNSHSLKVKRRSRYSFDDIDDIEI